MGSSGFRVSALGSGRFRALDFSGSRDPYKGPLGFFRGDLEDTKVHRDYIWCIYMVYIGRVIWGNEIKGPF